MNESVCVICKNLKKVLASGKCRSCFMKEMHEKRKELKDEEHKKRVSVPMGGIYESKTE